MRKQLEQTLQKENVQMANKHIKCYSTSLTHHGNTNYDHMTISMNAKQPFKTFQHLCMIKVLSNLG